MRLVPLLLVSLGLAACSRPSAPQPAAGALAAFDYRQSLKEVMRRVVDPAAVSLWARSGDIESADGTSSQLPTDDKTWTLAENEAATLVEAGNLLLMPERIQRLKPDDKDWEKFARGLITTASALKAATEKRNADDILRTGGDLYDACTACHVKYYIPFQSDASKDAPGAGAPGPAAPK
jgi:cytochrome c556